MDAITSTESNGSPQASTAQETARNVGRIEEIQGVVIDVTFPERLPEINHAITIKRPAAAMEEEAPGISTEAGGDWLVCEVQQHLGDDRVRAVSCAVEASGEPFDSVAVLASIVMSFSCLSEIGGDRAGWAAPPS